MKARTNICIAIVVCFLLAFPAAGQDSTRAQQAAQSWLALVDRGEYGEGYDAAGAIFKKTVTREKWIAIVEKALASLGGVKSRTVKSTTFSSTAPGAPNGQYALIQYNTTFERKEAALENVTVVREGDGTWRVVGYFIN
jgi:hypothetical protein